MIRAIIKHPNISLICVKDGESRVTGRINDRTLVQEYSSVYQKFIKSIYKPLLFHNKFLYYIFHRGSIKIFAHELNRITVKCKTHIVFINK